MSEWQPMKIETFALAKGGKRLPKGEKLTSEVTNHPYIRVVDFIDGIIATEKIQYIPDAVFPSIRKYTVNTNNVLVSIVGTIGLVALVPPELDGANLTENAAKILIIDQAVNNKFIAWYLKSPAGQHEIHRNTVGSTQLKLPLYGIKNIDVILPPLTEQKAIAHILGTLDDKIDLNRRMNATLEAMAQALFKSWFVDFDPVRAKMDGRPSTGSGQALGMDAPTAALFPDRLVDSGTELGEIPEGWEVGHLPDIIDINPVRRLAKGDHAQYLEMANMPTKGFRAEAWYPRPYNSGMRFTNGDTLVARITPCLENGKTAFIDFLDDGEIAWGSTEYIVLRPKEPLPPQYAYFLARTDDFRSFAIKGMTGTSGRQRVSGSTLEHYQVVQPDTNVAKIFGEAIRPLMKKVKSNSEQSQILATLRDTLLPRLMSGELRVGEAEEMVEGE